MSSDSFKSQRELLVNGKPYRYQCLKSAEVNGLEGISRLPFSLKILLENQLRFEDGKTVTKADILAFKEWLKTRQSDHEIGYRPTRVLMQDFTGVPAVVDLAAMRDAMLKLKNDPKKINPLCPVDLIIDHSVQVDKFGNKSAFHDNVEIEVERNHERYAFLKWGQNTFQDFRTVPPGTGICHQVNLEYIGRSVWSHEKDGVSYAYPDTLVGTDSHTTMINGLGVLGWGVGGIEAEAAMLGQPVSMLIPQVVGFRLNGKLKAGVTATDLVLTITQILREKSVVGKFVEFFGPGVKFLSLADRATIANMAPEYGATCGLFPIDEETIKYLQLTNRPPETIALVKAYAQAQGMWHDDQSPEAEFSSIVELDLSKVVPSMAGPKRPQDRVPLPDLKNSTEAYIAKSNKADQLEIDFPTTEEYSLKHGDVVIAAITSCTNTSNPSVMMAAGLLAKKAVEKGMNSKPWVKSSLAPGSKVVTDYLDKAGLTRYLEKLGFYLVGYGCTTCIGNSGPLPENVARTVSDDDLIVSAVLSGNRNFEGRIHPQVKANWLASPPLVVAFALAGTTRIDITNEPLGEDSAGNPVFLKDIWPSEEEIQNAVNQVSKGMFSKEYSEVFKGDEQWLALKVRDGETYDWPNSTYIKHPPFFENMTEKPEPIQDVRNARILAVFGDSVTTDHISPAGSIKPESPAGEYLISQGISIRDFNSYGARRGNHEVMMRGTFANIRIRNEMVPHIEGGYTRHFPSGKEMAIYDAAMLYKSEKVPLVVFAGKEYGTGSSRDWAAKGTLLLGVKAVIAESFERIHRSNLIGMGVLPLQFTDKMTRLSLTLEGDEQIEILGIAENLTPQKTLSLKITRKNGSVEEIKVLCRIDTQNELEYYRNGGILQYVLRELSGR